MKKDTRNYGKFHQRFARGGAVDGEGEDPGDRENLDGDRAYADGGVVERHPVTKRPVLHNADNSIATEESMTVEHPRMNEGKPTNIPSIWDGRRPPFEDRNTQEDWSVNQANKSGKTFESFPDISTAVEFAKARSKMLGDTYNKESDE